MFSVLISFQWPLSTLIPEIGSYAAWSSPQQTHRSLQSLHSGNHNDTHWPSLEKQQVRPFDRSSQIELKEKKEKKNEKHRKNQNILLRQEKCSFINELYWYVPSPNYNNWDLNWYSQLLKLSSRNCRLSFQRHSKNEWQFRLAQLILANFIWCIVILVC
jgi:hypothetical protein